MEESPNGRLFRVHELLNSHPMDDSSLERVRVQPWENGSSKGPFGKAESPAHRTSGDPLLNCRFQEPLANTNNELYETPYRSWSRVPPSTMMKPMRRLYVPVQYMLGPRTIHRRASPPRWIPAAIIPPTRQRAQQENPSLSENVEKHAFILWSIRSCTTMDPCPEDGNLYKILIKLRQRCDQVFIRRQGWKLASDRKLSFQFKFIHEA